MPVLLINKNDFKEFKQISKGRDIELIEQYVTEAQDIDIRSLICDKFYFDILKNWQLPAYQKLIHGETYTDEDGVEIEYKGLKPVLVYYAYSRYCMRGSVVDTAFGMVQKTNENSQPISISRKKRYERYINSYSVALLVRCKKIPEGKRRNFPEMVRM